MVKIPLKGDVFAHPGGGGVTHRVLLGCMTSASPATEEASRASSAPSCTPTRPRQTWGSVSKASLGRFMTDGRVTTGCRRTGAGRCSFRPQERRPEFGPVRD